MPFGLAIQVQTQEQEDMLILGWTRDVPIPMIPAVIVNGVETVPATPMYASRKAFAQALMRQESNARYIAHVENVQHDIAEASKRAANAAARTAIQGA